ncbi:hypothetical protein AN191_13185 [Loktanella sp. 5RATIMAR09]|uniref:hypothetical protein n=1 Tax=Loktanella sp. 5RATIMAR09 TaxID=1225655 RepID=UPI0006EBA14B|nr:hypothetical protein [Loktanella sp. 5RATIMAR09]KQI71246.1 hypothetical protein AN191_13185 [Loktanella sp. 5RATIMAR09]
MPRRKAKPKSPLRRTWPLDSEQHEAFVREYHESFDPVRAALRAGIETPHVSGPQLLEREDIQARLRGYRIGTDAPAHSASGIARHLLQSSFATRKPGLTQDIVTGQMRPNWELINEQDPHFVEHEEIIQNKGGIPVRTTRLRKRATFEALKTVAQQLDALVQHSGDSDDRLSQALIDISRRGSAAPIATEVRRKAGAAARLQEDKAKDT